MVGDENATLGRGGGVDGPGDAATEEIEDAGEDGMERTSATGLSLKWARRTLLGIMVGCCVLGGGGCVNKWRMCGKGELLYSRSLLEGMAGRGSQTGRTCRAQPVGDLKSPTGRLPERPSSRLGYQ